MRRPDQWFAQAHRCGLGAELEALALRAALAVADRPIGTFLALNVSPTGLLAPPVQDALPDDLSNVVIELTEHELFAAEETLEARLAELRARGARVALDDAGAGYAGLQQLIRVAPDILKIDRSLVHGAHADPSRYALLEALVSFAGTTGAAVCGEGVEDLADLHALADLDATYAQGYALGAPGRSVGGAQPGRGRHRRRCARASASRPSTIRDGGGWTRALAELGDHLTDVQDVDGLIDAGRRAAALLGAEDVSLMWVVDGCLELLSDNQDTPGERWEPRSYPATVRLLETPHARAGRRRRHAQRPGGGRGAGAARLRRAADGADPRRGRRGRRSPRSTACTRRRSPTPRSTARGSSCSSSRRCWRGWRRPLPDFRPDLRRSASRGERLGSSAPRAHGTATPSHCPRSRTRWWRCSANGPRAARRPAHGAIRIASRS